LGALPLNVWTHLAATYDGSEVRLYINGILAASRAVDGDIVNTDDPLRIGGNNVWGEFFSGLIDEVRVYNRPLTREEIVADSQNALPGSPPAAAAARVAAGSTPGLPAGTFSDRRAMAPRRAWYETVPNIL
jgi:hypothetical protein